MAVVDVVNLALNKIGQTNIVALTDGTPTANIAAAVYADTYKEVFRAHDWRSLRRTTKPVYTTATLAFTGGALGADTATASAAHFTADDVGRVLYEVDADGVDQTGVSTITTYTSATEVDVNTTVAWDDTTPAANRWRLGPHVGFTVSWAYEFTMPTNWVTVREAAWGADFSVEQGRILCNTGSGIVFTGTAYDATETNWDPLLKQAVVARLASVLAEPLTHDEKIIRRMADEYAYHLGTAKARDQQHAGSNSYYPTLQNRGR